MKINKNSVVTIHYTAFDLHSGELLEESDFSYIQGFNQFPEKVEEALFNKSVGDKVVVNLIDEYGEYEKEFIYTVHRDEISSQDDSEIHLGDEFEIDIEDTETNEYETRFARVIEINGDEIVIDANYDFAGKDVKFKVEILDVREATDKELKTGDIYIND